MTQLWIVGQRLNLDQEDRWEFVGVFESEELAVAACETPLFFVGPANLNASFGAKKVAWPGAYHPHPYVPDTADVPVTEETMFDISDYTLARDNGLARIELPISINARFISNLEFLFQLIVKQLKYRTGLDSID